MKEPVSTPQFLTRLDRRDVPFLADGAMGTMIHAQGVSFSDCFDELNITNPGLIAQIHRAYIDAGAELITTNSFGANRYRLGKHGLEDKVISTNNMAVELARRVVKASFQPVLIAGNVGPLGVRLAPYGRVHPQEARQAFTDQIGALVKAGVDLLILETFSDLSEIREGLKAAQDLSNLPIVASMTFTRDDLTLLGNSPEEAARVLDQGGATVIGINCSGGPSQILRILSRMRKVLPEGFFSVMPNAGLPEQVQGRIMYPAGPAYFGEYALAFQRAGAVLIGGCCGTTPDHIAAMRSALDNPTKQITILPSSAAEIEREDRKAEVEQPTQLAQRLTAGKFVVTVEIDPPRGFASQKLLAGASLLSESGADAINVADSPMARMRMSPWAVCSLIQTKIGTETTLHFPTRGRNLLRVQGDLLAAHALNVRNVFVVMGDPTSVGDYPDAMDDYDVVPSGLIQLIKKGFNMGVDYAGSNIGQPTSFFVSAALNLTSSNPEREMKTLHKKSEAGADFFLTQPVYNPGAAKLFLENYQAEFGNLKQFLLVGILPLYSLRHASFLHHEVPGIRIPSEILYRLEGVKKEPYREGIRIALELVDEVKDWADGIYLMPPFGRYDIAATIIEAII